MLRFHTPNSAPVDKSGFRRRALMQKRKIFFSFVLSALLSILLYIVLHEAGHCIVAILCGATITEFSILSAHMNYSGGNFTALSALFLSANGILFPLFLSYIYAFLYRAAAKNKFYRMMSFFCTLIPAFSLLPWVALPIAYRFGFVFAENDDSMNFLYNFGSSHDPLWVTAAALILIAISVVLTIKKGILRNYVEVMKEIKSRNSSFSH